MDFSALWKPANEADGHARVDGWMHAYMRLTVSETRLVALGQVQQFSSVLISEAIDDA